MIYTQTVPITFLLVITVGCYNPWLMEAGEVAVRDQSR